MIALHDFSLTYDTAKPPLYDHFSISFEEGSVTSILGASGSGKTTLLDALAASSSETCGYVFQEPRLLPWCSLQKNIMLPLEKKLSTNERIKRAAHFLEKTGLTQCANRLPSQVSGGERQRAALARAFAFPSRILLLDEAFQSQDMQLKIQLMELFKKLLIEEKRTVVIVTHDIREAIFLAERIIVIGGQSVGIRLDYANNKNTLSYIDTSNPTLEKHIIAALIKS